MITVQYMAKFGKRTYLGGFRNYPYLVHNKHEALTFSSKEDVMEGVKMFIDVTRGSFIYNFTIIEEYTIEK